MTTSSKISYVHITPLREEYGKLLLESSEWRQLQCTLRLLVCVAALILQTLVNIHTL